MEELRISTLEEALADMEKRIDFVVKAAASTLNELKKARSAAKYGNLRDMTKTLDSLQQSIGALQLQIKNTKDSWDFDSESYMNEGGYLKEFVEAAKTINVNVYEQDGLLYCYPFLIRILPGELAVQIDKTKDRRIRPSALANNLKKNQNKPTRFKPEVFLEGLYAAYKTLAKSDAEVIALQEVYRRLTILPGIAKEYTLAEFARDIYLLDLSGTNKTKSGHAIRLPASTGTRSNKNVIRIITKDGAESKYYGISFHVEQEASE